MELSGGVAVGAEHVAQLQETLGGAWFSLSVSGRLIVRSIDEVMRVYGS